MQITKFGHSCILIEEASVRILTDPGVYSVLPGDLINIDLILITHGHTDHLDVSVLKNILTHNKTAQILTNRSVGEMLSKEGVPFELLEDGQKTKIRGVEIIGIGDNHASIHRDWPISQNTAYLIANNIFIPGDSFTEPKIPIEILALPISSPWNSLGESIDYAIKVKPKFCIPIHDGNMVNVLGSHKTVATIIEKHGISFVELEIGKATVV